MDRQRQGTKWCPACQRELPLTDFYQSGGACSACRRNRQRSTYQQGVRGLRERVDALEKMVADLQAKVA